ncbi:MAG: excinuclease ABC subunit UvrC [Roseiflexus sp.]|nr:excinuclease ABC subunit UvrC [Roseiflexus sp.]MCS7288341.1 excinuclease ABC subunit UvrC [Roseiflexus sp.]MDW8233388.1 excinuclease ABC subunit UvrC [Roseiflexaceae bacterium]
MPDLTHTSIADPVAFEERLRAVPLAPGVYLWKDAQGKILYVGKSKRLRDRMRSYFTHTDNGKTARLVAQIADFQVIVTSTELEALLLEMNLIKQHRPRFNVLLKDDKSYPYIKVTLNEPWPRIFATRNPRWEEGARYFGPYSSAGAVYRTLDQLNRLFAFRPPSRCPDDKFNRHRRLGKPCLYYDIKRCLGPCVPGLVNQDEYRATIELVCRFLEGKSDLVAKTLRRQMEEAAERLDFERAARLRDSIRDIELISQRQQVLRHDDADQDVIGLAREEGMAVVQVLCIRAGKLISAESFPLQNAEGERGEELLASFLTQFYDAAAELPATILLPMPLDDPAIIEQWLAQKAGRKIALHVPQRGEKRRLIELAEQNARQKLDELRLQWLNSEQRAIAGLTEVRDLLGLSALPTRIECFDVSNTQGSHSVGAMVVFEHGEPKKSRYRKFKIKTVEGANDVASIQEVLRRRFQRAALVIGEEEHLANERAVNGQTDAEDQEEMEKADTPGSHADLERQETWAELPDLILIDGGIGQVNGALQVLRELRFDHIPIAGVVKGPNRDRFDLLLPGASDLIVLERDSAALRLIRRIDEEADRFAKDYHRKLRSKSATASRLEEIPGIGPKRRQLLLKRFGSLEGIRNATVDELAAVPGMTRKAAEELKSLL